MIECKNCKTETAEEIVTCNICSYPIQGNGQEQASFTAKQVVQKSDVEESIGRLKNARLILFGVAAFYIIGPFTPLMNSASSIALTITVILGFIFVGFGLLTYKMPVMALSIPLGLIIFYYLILLLIAPMLLFSGILWKMIIIMGLGYGLISVRKSNRILKENKYLASTLGYGKV